MSINASVGFLRRVLVADALSCAAMGLVLCLFNNQAAGILNLPSELLIQAGLALLPFAAFVAFVASRSIPSRKAVWTIMALNAVWIAESVLLLFSNKVQPNVLGQAFVVAQAAFVLVMTELEYMGLKRSMLVRQ
jgi:hypothetical protein